MFSGLPKPLKTQKAPQQIIQTIRSGILEGHLKAGQKLPCEQELMSHFGVSRQTMREALRALEAFGLLNIKVGSNGGAFVSEVDIDTANIGLTNFLFRKLSLTQLAHVRRAIEPYAIKMATPIIDDETLQILEANIHECHKALEKEDFVTLRRLEVDFHHHIIKAAQCPTFTLVHDFVQSVLLDMKNFLETKADFSNQIIASHERILGHLRKHDAQGAHDEILCHITIVESALNKIQNGEAMLKWV